MRRPELSQQITFLGVRDIQKTAAFYEEILDFPLILDQGGCRIYGVAGSAFTFAGARSGCRNQSRLPPMLRIGSLSVNLSPVAASNVISSLRVISLVAGRMSHHLAKARNICVGVYQFRS